MNMYSSAFKVSFWLACIITLCVLAFNIGHDVLPGTYYIGGPGLHQFTSSSYTIVNTLATGASLLYGMLVYVIVAAIEGLVIWLALYWSCKLFMRGDSPIVDKSAAVPSFVDEIASSQESLPPRGTKLPPLMERP